MSKMSIELESLCQFEPDWWGYAILHLGTAVFHQSRPLQYWKEHHQSIKTDASDMDNPLSCCRIWLGRCFLCHSTRYSSAMASNTLTYAVSMNENAASSMAKKFCSAGHSSVWGLCVTWLVASHALPLGRLHCCNSLEHYFPAIRGPQAWYWSEAPPSGLYRAVPFSAVVASHREPRPDSGNFLPFRNSLWAFVFQYSLPAWAAGPFVLSLLVLSVEVMVTEASERHIWTALCEPGMWLLPALPCPKLGRHFQKTLQCPAFIFILLMLFFV